MNSCPTCQATFPEDVAFCPHDGSPLSRAGDGILGKILGDRYRVMSLLGEGGMGCVYLGEHVVLGRKVAIKVLREELSRREDLMRRFQMEAIAASRIGHENIVDVTDFGRTPGGSLYFVMEYLGAESLSGLLRDQGALPAARGLPILIQVAKALGAAHAQGIVHRDLKADNVLIVQREERADLAKVLDFGISKFNDLSGENLTRVGAVLGTPEYMAPEQAAGQPVDLRSDIYSLGVLAYEVLGGDVPFRGDTVVATLMMHQQELPAPLRTRRPDLDLSPEVEDVVMRMLEKRREDRLQTMAEVVAELSHCLILLGPSAAVSIPPPRPIPAVTAPIPEPSASPAPIRLVQSIPPSVEPAAKAPSGRRVRTALLASAGALTAAGLAALLLVREGKAPAAAVHEPVAAATSASTVPAEEETPTPSLPPALSLPNPLPEGDGTKVPPAPGAVAVQPPVEDPPRTLKVTLHTIPEGALVTGSQGTLGLTPVEVELVPGTDEEYSFTLGGYRPQTRRVAAEARVVELRLARDVPTAGKKKPGDPPTGKMNDMKPNPFD